MELAVLMRDSKVPARPRVDGKLDGGAQEIRDLFSAAYAKGNPEVGLELARLYRKGFPEGRTSTTIPKEPALAVSLLWDTMDKVRAAEPSSWEARPEIEVRAAVELISMFDGGETKQGLITEDQITQLKGLWRYQSPHLHTCGGGRRRGRLQVRPRALGVIWNSKRSEPPAIQQKHHSKQRAQ